MTQLQRGKKVGSVTRVSCAVLVLSTVMLKATGDDEIPVLCEFSGRSLQNAYAIVTASLDFSHVRLFYNTTTYEQSEERVHMLMAHRLCG